jgi:hypothetical protein
MTYEAISTNQNSWTETKDGRRYEAQAYCGHQHATPQLAMKCAYKQWQGTTLGISVGIERNDGERMVEVVDRIWESQAEAAEYRRKENEAYFAV